MAIAQNYTENNFMHTPTIEFDKDQYQKTNIAIIRIHDDITALNADQIFVKFQADSEFFLPATKSPAGVFEVECNLANVNFGSTSSLTASYDYVIDGQLQTVSATVIVDISDPNSAHIPNPNTTPEDNVTTSQNAHATWFEDRIVWILNASDPDVYAQIHGLPFVKNSMITMIMCLASGSTATDLQNIGVKIEASHANCYQGSIQIASAHEVLEYTIDAVVMPTKPHQQGQSYGVKLLKVDQAHQAGITGCGVGIAVIDLAFDDAEIEIQPIKEAKSFRNAFGSKISVKGDPLERTHGTEVAAIIRDVAPCSNLYLYTMGTELEFLQAVDYIISKKEINVIVMSAGWLNYDTGVSNKLTQKVEESISKGKTVILSAGNYAQSHWEGKFVDQNKNRIHDFLSNQEELTVKVPQAQGVPIIAYLIWDKPDVDLNFILKKNGQIIDTSENDQTFDKRAVEYVTYVPDKTANYALVVESKNDVPSDTMIEIFSPIHQFVQSEPKGSIGVPQNAKGAIVVGAVNYDTFENNPKIASYSSQGPTNDNRHVISVVAPDGITTGIKNINTPFYGTSAAGPHVGGIVALLLEKNPGLSPDKIRQTIQQNAEKNITYLQGSFDDTYGFGKASAKFLTAQNNLASQIIPQPTGQSTMTDNSPESALASQTTLKITKEYPAPKYKESSLVPLKGIIEQKMEGLPVDITIKKPDGKTENLSVMTTKTGEYTANLQIKHDSPQGIYEITIKHNSDIIDQYAIKVGKEQKTILSNTKTDTSTNNKPDIPNWIRSNAKWWAEGKIGDSDFVQGIKFLISQGIVNIPQTDIEKKQSTQIPQWIRSNAKWWAEGKIGDSDFVQGIQFLIRQGIITISPNQVLQQNTSSANMIQQSYDASISQNKQDSESTLQQEPDMPNYIVILDVSYRTTSGEVVSEGKLGTHATPWIKVSNPLTSTKTVEFEYVLVYPSGMVQPGRFSVDLVPSGINEFWCPCGNNFDRESGTYYFNMKVYDPVTGKQTDGYVTSYAVLP